MIEIDVRGLSCPQPVLEVQKVLEKNPNEELKVIADEAHTVKNITKFCKNLKREVQAKEVGIEYELIIK